MPKLYPLYDLRALASSLDTDFDEVMPQLRALYTWVAGRTAENTADLDLPCTKGCDRCCHESVFLTPLEFMLAWDQLQKTVDDQTRSAIIEDGLQIYTQYRTLIDALDEKPKDGEADHFSIAEQLKFRCPLLDPHGACRVYDSRELYARLFGSAFNAEGGVYGCHMVGQHLSGKVVTLVRAREVAGILAELPLTFKRQVYPYYIDLLYG